MLLPIHALGHRQHVEQGRNPLFNAFPEALVAFAGTLSSPGRTFLDGAPLSSAFEIARFFGPGADLSLEDDAAVH
jgi:hypothetical protein